MQSTRSDERTLELTSLGLRTRVIDSGGAGPVVLFLHGNPDNADEWRLVIERLQDRFRCIAPDFPGYGHSIELKAGFGYSLIEQQCFVDAVLAALEVTGPLILVVHDTGGMVGTAWAAANTARLRGVVFTNTVAFENFPWFRIARQWGDASWSGRLRSALGMHALGLRGGALFRRVFSRQSPQLDSTQVERFVLSFALNSVAKQATLRQFRAFVQPTFFEGFERMRLKLTEDVACRVLWGNDDPYLSTTLAHRFGRAPVTVLPGVGHWVALVAPERLAAEIAILAG